MILVLIGPPGCGKGTQADMLVERQGFAKLSTGDLLRSHIAAKTDIGMQAEGFMAQGKLVPDAVLMNIIGREIEKLGNKVILDGFPRNVNQAIELEKLLGGFNKVAVLSIKVEEEEIVKRITGRRICAKCGASYHVLFNVPKTDGKCDKCGGDLVQRPDDNVEKVSVRLGVYKKDTQPVIEYFSKLCYTREVIGTGNKEDIFERLSKELKLAEFH